MWLSEEELECVNPDLIDYLHGKCNEWVFNNYKNGDNILIISEFSYEINKECLVHCCLIRGNSYIDVRGETSNLDDILDGFDYNDYSVLACEDLNSFSIILKQLGVIF